MPQGLQSFQPGFWSCVLVLCECWVPLPLLWTGRSFLGSDSLHTGWSVLCCNLKGDPFSGLLWSFKNLCVILTQGHSNLYCSSFSVMCCRSEHGTSLKLSLFAGLSCSRSSVFVSVSLDSQLCLLSSWSLQAGPGSPPCAVGTLW